MTAAGERARPEPSALTAPFWAAARDHVLVRPRCNDCGNSFFTPQIACTACLSENWSYERSTGRGTVYSATVVHRAPLPGFDPPYQVGIVDMEEGWSMLANLADGPRRPTPIGTPVQVAWVDVDAELTLPVFETVAEVDR